MRNVITEYIEQFAYLTGKIGNVREKEAWISIILILLGGCLCVTGIVLYRQIISVFVFSLLAQGIILLMGNSSSWGTTVTTFAILGVASAYIVWDKKYFDGILLCMVLSGLIASEFIFSLVLTMLAVCVGLVLFLLFPVETICLLSSVSGAVLLQAIFDTMSPFYGLLLGIVGFAIQMLISLKYSAFDNRYPDWTMKLFRRNNE